MTLDEAIKHAEEVADKKDREKQKWERWLENDSDYRAMAEKVNCELCAKEHRQLVGWLKELKRYRETNTVSIDGVLYMAAEPKLKTIHGKTGEVVIGGFKEVHDDPGV
jgi:hypothetical protein